MRWIMMDSTTSEVLSIKLEGFEIGRDKQADLICRNILVSKYHSRITIEDGKPIIVDLKSSNGTFVNKEKIHPFDRVVLKDGDEVSFGMTKESGTSPFYIFKICGLPDVIEILSDNEEENVPTKESSSVKAGNFYWILPKEEKLDEHQNKNVLSSAAENDAQSVNSSNTTVKLNSEIISNVRPKIDLETIVPSKNHTVSGTIPYKINSERLKLKTVDSDKKQDTKKGTSIESKVTDNNHTVANIESAFNGMINSPIVDPMCAAETESTTDTSEQSFNANLILSYSTTSKKSSLVSGVPSESDEGIVQTGDINNVMINGMPLDTQSSVERNSRCDKSLEESQLEEILSVPFEVYKPPDDMQHCENLQKELFKSTVNDQPEKNHVGKIKIATNLFQSNEKEPTPGCSGDKERGSAMRNVEVKIEPVEKPQEYSCEDRIIVVGDDDDPQDFGFMFSQLYVKEELKVEEIVEEASSPPCVELFGSDYIEEDDDVLIINNYGDHFCMPIHIKEEDRDQVGRIDDEEFMRIKNEVAEMDHYDDYSRLPPVVINDSMEFANGEGDLLADLEKTITDSPVVAPTERPKEVNGDGGRVLRKSYTKPPIVEAHQIQLSRRGKRVSNVKPAFETPPKKTRTINKDPRRYNFNGKGKRKADACTNPINKETKEQIHEVRRQKLKEIAAAKTDNECQSKVQKPAAKITTAKHTKTSSGRGLFLLPSDVPSTSNTPVRTELVKNNIQNMRHVQSRWRFVEDFLDIILSIIHWNISWMDEQRSRSDVPPLTSKPIIKMCNSFVSFEDYKAVLVPLIITELWFNVCKEYDTSAFPKKGCSSVNVIARIKSIRPMTGYTEMLCNSYLEKKYSDFNHLQVKNVVLLNAHFKSPSRQAKYVTCFGVVAWVQKESLKMNSNVDKNLIRTCGTAPTTNLSFMLIVKSFKQELNHENLINLRYFTFLPQYLRLISSVESLKTSPLLNHILEPKNDTYKLPCRNRQLLGQKDLNVSQREAINDVLSLYESDRPGIYLIEGPPGTGKSTVIINIIMEFLVNQNCTKECLLVLAPTNAAIDYLINRFILKVKPELNELDRKRAKLVRIGNQNAIDPSVKGYSLEELARSYVQKSFFKEHPQSLRDFEIIKEQITTLQNILQKNPTDQVLVNELEKKKAEHHNFAKNYLKSRYQSKLDEHKLLLLQNANIICSTLMSSPKILFKRLDTRFIKMCIIDEASQCTEPESLIPISLGIQKMVLIGDPRQLPAISNSVLVKQLGYCQSLMTRIKFNLSRSHMNPIKLLNIQYRMNPEISFFPNHTYYKGMLRNGFKNRRKCMELLNPYMVFSQVFLNPSEYENLKEIEYIIHLIKAISQVVQTDKPYTVGIITPYSVQSRRMNDQLKQLNLRSSVSITCNTVDGFQGQEKDIVLLSCVRNSSNSFLSDEQRLNVSLTRARYALYIIGTQSLLESCSAMKKITQDAHQRKLFYKLNCTMNESIFADLIRRKV